MISSLGCGATGVISDFGNTETKITSAKLSTGKTLEVLSGGTVLNIALTKIRSIRLHQNATKNFQGKLYLLAEVIFQDATKIGTFNKNSNTPKAWVRGDVYVEGKTEKGRYRILLQNVAKLNFTIQ